MATFSELIVRIGADIAPLSEGLNQAITALESAGTAATKSGNAISKAFSTLGVKDSAAQTAAAVKNLQKAFEQIETAYETGKVTTADFTKAQAALRVELEKLTKVPVKSFADSFAGLDKIAGQLKSVGASLTAAITVPLAGISAASVKMAGDFESSMNKVRALGDITGDALKQLEDLALDLGAKTKYSAKEAADGMAELAAAGLNAQQIAASMPAVLDLAAAGELAVGRAAETAANLMGGFGIAAQDMGHAVDVIAKAAASGTQSVDDMANTFKYVGPIAKSAGLSLEEVSAAVTLLANAGIKGEQAGTGIRGMLAKLIDPSKEAAEAMKALGVHVTDAQGKLKPLEAILTELGTKANSTQALFKIFGQESASAVQALVNQGAPALRKLTEEFTHADGAAKQMADTMNQGIKGAMERAKGSIETAGIAIGKALGPTAEKVAGVVETLGNKMVDLAKWFANLPEPIQNAALAVGAFATALGPLALGGGALASSIMNIGKLFAAISGAGAIQSAITTLGGLTTSITGIGAAASAAAPLLVALGIAIAGWAIDKALTQLEQLDNQLRALEDAQARGVKATQAQAQEIEVLTNTLKRSGKEIPSVFDSISGDVKPVQEYVKELRKAVGALDEFKGKATQTGDVVKNGAINFSQAVEQYGKAGNTVKLTGNAIQDAIAQYGRMGTATQDASKKTVASTQQIHAALQGVGKEAKDTKDKLEEAFKTIGIKDSAYEVQKHAGEATKALRTIEESYKAGKVSASDWARAQQEAWKALNPILAIANQLQGKKTADNWLNWLFPPTFKQAAKEFLKDAEEINAELNKLQQTAKGDKNVALTLQLPGVAEVTQLAKAIEAVGGAQENLATQVGEARKNYEALNAAAAAGLATQEQVSKSRIELLKAEIELAKEKGNIAEAERKQNELAAASLEKVITLTDAYHAIGVKSLGELKAEADQLRQAYERIAEAAAQGQASQTEVLEAKKKQLEADRELAKATGQSWADIDVALQRVQKELDRLYDLKGLDALTKAWHDFAVGVGDTINKSLTEGLHSIFESIRNLDFGDIGKSLGKIWDDLKTNLQRVAISAFVDPIEKGLDRIITKITDKITDLLTKAVDKVLDKIAGKALDKGIDAAMGAAGLGTQAASGATGAAGKAASSGAGGAMSAVGGLAGAVNMASGIASAVSSIIGNFQMARLEGTMNQVERNTAAGSIHLRYILEKLNAYLPAVKSINDAWYKYFEYFASLMSTVENSSADILRELKTISYNTAAITLSGGGGEGGSIAGLDVLYKAVQDGSGSIVSAINAGVEKLSTASSAGVGAIGDYQKRLNDLLAQNAWIEADIGRKMDALSKTTDTAAKAQLQVEIDQLTAIKAKNNAEIESIRTALGAFGTVTKETAQATTSATVNAIEEMTHYLAELLQQQAGLLEKLPPEIRTQLEAGSLGSNLDNIDESTKATIDAFRALGIEIQAVREAINSTTSKAAGVTPETTQAAKDSRRTQIDQQLRTETQGQLGGGFTDAQFMGYINARLAGTFSGGAATQDERNRWQQLNTEYKSLAPVDTTSKNPDEFSIPAGSSNDPIRNEAAGNAGVIGSVNALNIMIADRFAQLFDILTQGFAGQVKAGTNTAQASTEATTAAQDATTAAVDNATAAVQSTGEAISTAVSSTTAATSGSLSMLPTPTTTEATAQAASEAAPYVQPTGSLRLITAEETQTAAPSVPTAQPVFGLYPIDLYPSTPTEQGYTPSGVAAPIRSTVNINVGNIRNQNDVDYLVNQLQYAGVRI